MFIQCTRCTERAVVHVTEIEEDSNYSEVHLCPLHAQEYFEEISNEEKTAATGDELQPSNLTDTSKSCPICGAGFSDFRSTGRLGCPYDYETFHDELKPLLDNIHWSTKHIGKIPKKRPRDVHTQTKLLRLRRQLQDAIAMEDYERAASIRDEINTTSTEEAV